MATTNTIPDHYTIKFDSSWSLAIQQKLERLRKYVTVHTGCTGKARTHNRISSEEMNEQTTRLQTTQGTELTTVKRWVFPRPHEKTTYLDEWDNDLLGDTVLPSGDAVRVHRAAAARKMDKLIIDGIGGTNYEGGDNDVGSLTAKVLDDVDTTNHIDNTAGGTPAGNLQLQDLIDAKSVLGTNETYGQDQKEAGDSLCLAVNQSALDSLLQETELTSADYAAVKALVDGEVSYFMGMHIVRTEQLLVNNLEVASVAGAGDGVLCLMWAKSHVHFDVWSDMRSRISIRDDLSEAIQIRTKLMAGACRDQDEAVVWIDCDQT